jgi:hypothetical protein
VCVGQWMVFLASDVFGVWPYHCLMGDFVYRLRVMVYVLKIRYAVLLFLELVAVMR